MTSQGRRTAGFTLIELLLAITVFALLMIGVYQAFDQGFRTYQIVEENRVRYETARLLLDRIQDDLSSAVIFPSDPLLVFIGEDHADRDGNPRDRLVMSTLTNVLLDPRLPQSDLVEVEYFVLVDEDTGQRRLLRREDPYPDEVHDRGGRVAVLADDVVGIDFRYYDGEQWLERWDGTDRGQEEAARLGLDRSLERNFTLLPKAVQTVLWLEDPAGNPMEFRALTLLPMSRPLVPPSQPGGPTGAGDDGDGDGDEGGAPIQPGDEPPPPGDEFP